LGRLLKEMEKERTVEMFGKERSWCSEAAVEKDDNLCTLFSQDLGCQKYFWEKYCTGKNVGF
jgi:hypothetical protein